MSWPCRCSVSSEDHAEAFGVVDVVVGVVGGFVDVELDPVDAAGEAVLATRRVGVGDDSARVLADVHGLVGWRR